MITIHEATATDFSTLGICALTPAECTVEEKAGGLYELTIVQPFSDDFRHEEIKHGRIIKAPAPVRETPRLRINQTTGETVERKIYQVKTDGRPLRLRTGPGEQYRVLGAYEPGTEVVRDKTDGDWAQVVVVDGGAAGWMFDGNLAYVRTETETVVDDSPGVVIKPRQTREQLFRIHTVEPDTRLRSVTAYAQHITYDLKGAVVTGEYAPENRPADEICRALVERADHDISEFNIYCTVTDKISGDYTDRNILDCLFDPENGVVAQTQARVVRDNYDLFILPDQERDRGLEIRYGKNLLSAALTTDTSDIITRIRPVGKNKEGEPLYIDSNNGFVDSPRINNYPTIYAKKIEYDVIVNDDVTEDEAKTALAEKAQAEFDAGCDLPSIKLNADFVRLELTEEYRELASAYALHLYDAVPVIDEKAGISARVRMVGYVYDAVLDRYSRTDLGDITEAEASVFGYELAAGSVSGTKIIPNSLDGTRLKNQTIDYAKISRATINQLNANSITAVRADIRKLVAGEITTDQLYADLATIAAAQITAANIDKANIEWAEIETLAAEIATIAQAEITTANIEKADIDWASIDNLTASIATIATAQIAAARIGWAQIDGVNVTSAQIALGAITTALIAQGAVGTAQIADGSVTSAKIVELTADVIKSGTLSTERLIIKGAGSLIYEINATAGGLTAAQLTQEQYQNAISGTALVAKSITADQIAAKTITANQIASNTITAAEINVANLFAAEATITALTNYLLKASTIEALQGELNVWAEDKISLAVSDIQVGGRNYALGTGTSYTATGQPDRGADLYLYPWPCASVDVVKSLHGKTVTVSFDYDANITSGSFILRINATWQTVKNFSASDNGSGHFSTTIFASTDQTPTIEHFLSIRGTWGGTVAFSKMKVEIGNKETDWTPAPEDTDAEFESVRSEIKVTRDEISLAVNDVRVGGTQLIKRTRRLDVDGTVDTWAISGNVTLSEGSDGFRYAAMATTGQTANKWIWITSSVVELPAGWKGRQATMSAYVYSPDWTKVDNGLIFTLNLSDKNRTRTLYCNAKVVDYNSGNPKYGAGVQADQPLTGGKWLRIACTFTLSEEGMPSGSGDFDSNTHMFASYYLVKNGEVRVYAPKLEWGNKGTDWSQHPEEFEAGTDVRITKDQFRISTPEFNVDIRGEDGDETMLRIDKSGVYTPHLEAPNVAERYDGPATLYVDSAATSAQVKAGTHFRSLAQVIEALNYKWISESVTVSVAAGHEETGTLILQGIHGGDWINIYGASADHALLRGTLCVHYCSAPIRIRYIDVVSTGTAIQVGGRMTMAQIDYCILTGPGESVTYSYGVDSTNGALARISNLQVYEFYRSFYGQLGGVIAAQDCAGNSLVGANKSSIYLTGTMPCSSTSWTSGAYAAHVLTGGVTVDQGSKPTTPAVTTTTASYGATNSDVYAGGGWKNYDNSDIYQGYTTALGEHRGCFWFNNTTIRSALKNKTIKQATLTLYQMNGAGRNQPVQVNLEGITVGSGTGNTPTGKPEYGVIGTTLGVNRTTTFTLPKAVVSDLAAGTINGLMLRTGETEVLKNDDNSYNYARFAGYASGNKPVLTVVYA